MEYKYQGPSSIATPQNDAYHDGLEVAPTPHQDLEVDPSYQGPVSVASHQHAPANSHSRHWESKTLFPEIARPLPPALACDSQGGGSSSSSSGNCGAKSRGKTTGFAVGAVVAVIIAGVVSGIAAWQVTEASSRNRIAALEAELSEGSRNMACKQNDTTAAQETIQRGSFLSVTGTRPSGMNTDYEMRVYYQKPNGGHMFYQMYHTFYQAWSKPLQVNSNGVNNAPMASSPLAASIALTNDGRPLPWNQLLYVTQDHKIAMQDWGPQYPAWGTKAVTYTGLNKVINRGGQMAYLWPQTVLEESTGSSSSSNHQIKFSHMIQNYTQHEFSSMQVTPKAGISQGTGILVLPLKQEHRVPELRIVYRTGGGHLGIFDRTAQNQTDEAVLTRISLADKTPIAGFASRPGDNPLLTTKLVFRGADNRIQIMTQSNGNGDLSDTNRWEGPETDKVFEKADRDSQISCLANAIAKYGSVTRNVLGHDEMSFCFFQEDSKLKQVHWDGKEWKTIGFVPMPVQ